MKKISIRAFALIDDNLMITAEGACAILNITRKQFKNLIEYDKVLLQASETPNVIRRDGKYYFSPELILPAAAGIVDGIDGIENFSIQDFLNITTSARNKLFGFPDSEADNYISYEPLPSINSYRPSNTKSKSKPTPTPKPAVRPPAPSPRPSPPKRTPRPSTSNNIASPPVWVDLPPVKTSLFDTRIIRQLTDEDFILINGRAMLPQDVVAKFFEIPVESMREYIRYTKSLDWRGNDIVLFYGRYYFASADAMMAIKNYSPYREAKISKSDFEHAFNEMTHDLRVKADAYSEIRQPQSSSSTRFSNSSYSLYDHTEPPRMSEKESKFFKLGFGLLFLICILLMLLFNDGSSKKKPPEPAAVEIATQTPEPAPPPAPKPEPKPEPATPPPKPTPSTKPAPAPASKRNLIGRGGDPWEPHYTGVYGYAAVGRDEMYELNKNFRYLDTPWQVITYYRDKQFWERSERTLEHKTQIIVREEFLTPGKHNFYDGYLKVERLSDGEQFYIKPNNFVVKPYWSEIDIMKAVAYAYDGGLLLVEYHQRSEYWPVDTSNRKKEIPDGTILLETARNNIGRLESTHQIGAYHSEYGLILFNKADLKKLY